MKRPSSQVQPRQQPDLKNYNGYHKGVKAEMESLRVHQSASKAIKVEVTGAARLAFLK
jgi:hypothetical protein